MNVFRKALVSCLVAMLIVTPSALGESPAIDSTPLNHDIVFSLDDGSMEIAFKRVANGYLMWRADRDIASPKLITDVELAQLKVISREESEDSATVHAALSDGLGGEHQYVISEHVAGDQLKGSIEVGAKGLLVPYTIKPAARPGRGGGGAPRLRPATDWFIIIGAGVILAAGCVINAIKTDCAAECSSGCGSNGMKSSDESLCGQCECECKT